MGDIYFICENVYLKKMPGNDYLLQRSDLLVQVLAYDSFGGKPVFHSALTNVIGHRNILLWKSNENAKTCLRGNRISWCHLQDVKILCKPRYVNMAGHLYFGNTQSAVTNATTRQNPDIWNWLTRSIVRVWCWRYLLDSQLSADHTSNYVICVCMSVKNSSREYISIWHYLKFKSWNSRKCIK